MHIGTSSLSGYEPIRRSFVTGELDHGLSRYRNWRTDSAISRAMAAISIAGARVTLKELAGTFEELPHEAVQSAYTLTSICAVEHTMRVESVFEIIAEPNRRAILRLLVSSEQSVGEIERQLRIPQPAVSKHLRVLREAGFVESTVDAQRRLYRLKPEALQEVDAWLAPFRRLWSAHVDALERHLDQMDQSTLTKRKTRRRR